MRSTRSKWISSCRRTPCPICGRHHDGSCRIGSEMVLCWRGSTYAPPAWAQRSGDHGPGADEQDWAFLGDRDGWAMFRPDRPIGQDERRQLSRRFVEVKPRWADGGDVQAFWEEEATNYRPTNWIVAALYQRHCLANGWEVPL